MKKLFFAFILVTLFTCSSCKKSSTAEDQLPPETTTGAMTFGCKVDGKVFVPRDGNGHPGLYVQYVYLGNGLGGGWFLNIPAIDYQTAERKNINISTDSLLLVENNVYAFKNLVGHPQAFYSSVGNVYKKMDLDSGNLFIKKHDLINHILSGTFSFIATNSSGHAVNITDGRFDIKY